MWYVVYVTEGKEKTKHYLFTYRSSTEAIAKVKELKATGQNAGFDCTTDKAVDKKLKH